MGKAVPGGQAVNGCPRDLDRDAPEPATRLDPQGTIVAIRSARVRFASPYTTRHLLTQSIRGAGSRTGLCLRRVRDSIMPIGCGTGCHAERVGSLLCPPTLLEARERHAAGHMSATRLRKLEDDAALSAIAAQRDAVRIRVDRSRKPADRGRPAAEAGARRPGL